MALPITTVSTPTASDAPRPSPSTPRAPASDRPVRRVLLVGPAAAPLNEQMPLGVATDCVESFLEAVLVLGPEAAYEAIIAGVSQDVDELERALTAIRKVAGPAKIYLLCEPADEVTCRRARAWGATDYFILPVAKAALDRMLARPAPGPTPRPRRGESPAEALASPVELSVVQMPLVVQSVMVHSLLESHANFVDKALATLQAYLRWPGQLRFEPAAATAAPPRPQALRATVALGAMTFGVLALEATGEAAAPGDTRLASQLEQSATWLAGWMAMAHRHEQLRTLAITDELSGAYNRRYFNRFTTSLLERAKLERFRVSILLFDIDNFKKYNDLYGHAAGDSIIREMIRLLRTCTRPHDLVSRLGGDEFAVVFWDNEPPRQPGSQHPKDAVGATERFRRVLSTHDWKKGCNVQGEVSISGGLATFPWDGETIDVLMAKADAALLRAKAAGKNAIVLHETLEERTAREATQGPDTSR